MLKYNHRIYILNHKWNHLLFKQDTGIYKTKHTKKQAFQTSLAIFSPIVLRYREHGKIEEYLPDSEIYYNMTE